MYALTACAAFAPAWACAETTIVHVHGVEIITFERDTPRPPHTDHPQRLAAHPSAAASVAIRREVPAAPMGLRGADSLIRDALQFVGTPYVWGGTSPSGFDCSGYTYYIFARAGIRIPRTADVQFAAGRPVVGDPLPGDLVFFQTYDYGASHVGIYLGGGRFVNSIGANVHIATFASEYFRARYLGARRFLST